ncbi:Uncharacterised protein [Serratia entomophila]|nr:Uncharacterised protein [Serratia entomophila]
MPANELSLDGKSILDMCCGSRMFWFDKQDERAVFSDKRSESHTLCDGRKLVISPDLIADFTALPFADGSFPVVVFDPPHLERVGPNGWQVATLSCGKPWLRDLKQQKPSWLRRCGCLIKPVI